MHILCFIYLYIMITLSYSSRDIQKVPQKYLKIKLLILLVHLIDFVGFT